MECLKLGGTQGKWVSKHLSLHMYLKSLSYECFLSVTNCGVGKLFDEATSISVGANISYAVHPNKCCSVNETIFCKQLILA